MRFAVPYAALGTVVDDYIPELKGLRTDSSLGGSGEVNAVVRATLDHSHTDVRARLFRLWTR
jgi:hypothetical protein